MRLRDSHHRCLHQLGLHQSHISADRRLADLGTMLRHETLPHTVRRVTLLPRNLNIRLKPGTDRVLPRTQHRGITMRGLTWRRYCVLNRLTYRATMHTMGISQPADRRPLTMLATYRLKQLHPRHPPLPLRPASPSEATESRNQRTRWGQIKRAKQPKNGTKSDKHTHRRDKENDRCPRCPLSFVGAVGCFLASGCAVMSPVSLTVESAV